MSCRSLVAVALLLVLAIVAIARMGTAFLPEFNEGTLTVQANTLPGTSLPKSDEIGRRVEQILLAQPEVVATARRTGRATRLRFLERTAHCESETSIVHAMRDHARAERWIRDATVRCTHAQLGVRSPSPLKRTIVGVPAPAQFR